MNYTRNWNTISNIYDYFLYIKYIIFTYIWPKPYLRSGCIWHSGIVVKLPAGPTRKIPCLFKEIARRRKFENFNSLSCRRRRFPLSLIGSDNCFLPTSRTRDLISLINGGQISSMRRRPFTRL